MSASDFDPSADARYAARVRRQLALIGEDPSREKASRTLRRAIELYSMCEHHVLPFFGIVPLAYIRAGRIFGLSRLPRLVDHFARRLQMQERMTNQIAAAIEEVLQPPGG